MLEDVLSPCATVRTPCSSVVSPLGECLNNSLSLDKLDTTVCEWSALELESYEELLASLTTVNDTCVDTEAASLVPVNTILSETGYGSGIAEASVTAIQCCSSVTIRSLDGNMLSFGCKSESTGSSPVSIEATVSSTSPCCCCGRREMAANLELFWQSRKALDNNSCTAFHSCTRE